MLRILVSERLGVSARMDGNWKILTVRMVSCDDESDDFEVWFVGWRQRIIILNYSASWLKTYRCSVDQRLLGLRCKWSWSLWKGFLQLVEQTSVNCIKWMHWWYWPWLHFPLPVERTCSGGEKHVECWSPAVVSAATTIRWGKRWGWKGRLCCWWSLRQTGDEKTELYYRGDWFIDGYPHATRDGRI